MILKWSISYDLDKKPGSFRYKPMTATKNSTAFVSLQALCKDCIQVSTPPISRYTSPLHQQYLRYFLTQKLKSMTLGYAINQCEKF